MEGISSTIILCESFSATIKYLILENAGQLKVNFVHHKY